MLLGFCSCFLSERGAGRASSAGVPRGSGAPAAAGGKAPVGGKQRENRAAYAWETHGCTKVKDETLFPRWVYFEGQRGFCEGEVCLDGKQSGVEAC